MENKEFTELANSWVERRKRIDSADVFNRQLLSETLVAKSFWLAPKPMAFCIMLSMFFIFAMTYCVLAKPSYWPVAAMCIFGLADTAWQTSMRDKIRRMDGDVVGLQTNLLRYRRGYIRLSIAMWIAMIPFLWWYGWFFDLYSDPATAIICISILAAACILTFYWRTRKTFRALGDLQSLATDLKDLNSD